VYDALCYGAISLDISGRTEPPSRGAQASATDYRLSPGGDATLVALTLAGLGRRVALSGGPIGDDPMGEYLREILRQFGIDLYVDNSGNTSISAVIVGRHGDRTSITFHEDTPLEQIQAPTGLIADSRYLYACGCYGRNARIMGEQAKTAGVPSLLNVNGEEMTITCPFDCAIIGEDYARARELSPEMAVLGLRDAGASISIATLGERGLLCSSSEETISMQAHRIKAIDCTGAGAAFAAGYIHASLNGLSLPERLRTASAAGALKCMVRGSYRRITPGELEGFMTSKTVDTI